MGVVVAGSVHLLLVVGSVVRSAASDRLPPWGTARLSRRTDRNTRLVCSALEPPDSLDNLRRSTMRWWTRASKAVRRISRRQPQRRRTTARVTVVGIVVVSGVDFAGAFVNTGGFLVRLRTDTLG